MKVSTEEFFMYLTIALIVFVPIMARLYRYVTAKQMKRTLHEQFGRPRIVRMRHDPKRGEMNYTGCANQAGLCRWSRCSCFV